MFIQLTDLQTNLRVAFKVDSICKILDGGKETLIYTIDGRDLWVSESYDEIMKGLKQRQALKDLASMIHPTHPNT